MNSYQELKKENETLREHLYTIITRRNSTEAQMLMVGYSMRYTIEKFIGKGGTLDVDHIQNAHIKNNEGYLIGSGFDITKPETYKQAVKMEMFQDMDCPCPNK